jgi:hypothetical protein
MKLTKQGVRNLDAEFPRKKSKRIKFPPFGFIDCKRHRYVVIDKIACIFQCTACGNKIDYEGKPYNY